MTDRLDEIRALLKAPILFPIQRADAAYLLERLDESERNLWEQVGRHAAAEARAVSRAEAAEKRWQALRAQWRGLRGWLGYGAQQGTRSFQAVLEQMDRLEAEEGSDD